MMTTPQLLRRRSEWIHDNPFMPNQKTVKAAKNRFLALSKPLTAHLSDHAYTIAGFGLISAASFVHSVFSGLLITGFLALVFEWKVSD